MFKFLKGLFTNSEIDSEMENESFRDNCRAINAMTNERIMTKIVDTDLPNYVKNALIRVGLKDCDDLFLLRKEGFDFTDIKGIGEKGANEITHFKTRSESNNCRST
jgi:hypothetical protein